METQIYDDTKVHQTILHACIFPHGTVEDLLSLVPRQASNKARSDPFVTLSNRAATR